MCLFCITYFLLYTEEFPSTKNSKMAYVYVLPDMGSLVAEHILSVVSKKYSKSIVAYWCSSKSHRLGWMVGYKPSHMTLKPLLFASSVLLTVTIS